MNKSSIKDDDFQFKNYHLIIILVGIVIISIGILASSIFFFSQPKILSGIIFGLCILILGILPIILGIIFYFKKIKPSESDEVKIIEIQEKKFTSRIDDLE